MRDGHIHTKYCPHGSADLLDQYVERAIEQGFSDITFTEHAPLPAAFTDPAPERDSAMAFSDLDHYLKEVDAAKKKYASAIRIRTGLEVDFIPGFERETTAFLNEYGPLLDDSILSVHFLLVGSEFVCVDFSDDEFERIVRKAQSVERVYQLYYDTVLQSIESNLGVFKPSRIGHMTLVRKFQQRFPCSASFDDLIIKILKAVKKSGAELDYNGAGAVKPLCRETYPPVSIAEKASAMNIPLVYGSDAHAAAGIGQGLNQINLTLIERRG